LERRRGDCWGGISKSSAQRYFRLFGIKPHRTKSFNLSDDALFVEKLRALVGLYLNLSDNALVLRVDEKSRCQALERTQPMLPLGLGYVEGVTHDYKRHGATTLFAALDLQNGAVLADCKRGTGLIHLPGLYVVSVVSKEIGCSRYWTRIRVCCVRISLIPIESDEPYEGGRI
jgi:hypothetical protein